ncbi:MAG: tetratricopeptide repeat protein [Terriglobales bacterium]
MLGIALAQLGQRERARQALNTCLRLRPEPAAAQRALAVMAGAGA